MKASMAATKSTAIGTANTVPASVLANAVDDDAADEQGADRAQHHRPIDHADAPAENGQLPAQERLLIAGRRLDAALERPRPVDRPR